MILTNISTIKSLLERHNFSFKKSLGQNFLINPSVCPRMAKAALCDNAGRLICAGVLEIGAGVGVLTRELSEIAARVAVIEIDERLKPVLTETLADRENVTVAWADALDMDLRGFIDENFGGEEIAVCANLPYYIAAHVIMTLLEQRLPISSITVMVQEEVARRVTALPGSKQYGLVSVVTRYFCEPKLLFKVSRGSFIPSPNVDSAVIKLDVVKGDRFGIESDDAFIGFIKAAFSQRRKQLANPVSDVFGVDKEEVKAALFSCGLNPASRAEDLGLEDFIMLYDACRGRGAFSP